MSDDEQFVDAMLSLRQSPAFPHFLSRLRGDLEIIRDRLEHDSHLDVHQMHFLRGSASACRTWIKFFEVDLPFILQQRAQK